MDAILDTISELVGIDRDELKQRPTEYGLGKLELWDSLIHLAIMTEIEDKFEIELTVEEMEALSDVASILNFIESHRSK